MCSIYRIALARELVYLYVLFIGDTISIYSGLIVVLITRDREELYMQTIW